MNKIHATKLTFLAAMCPESDDFPRHQKPKHARRHFQWTGTMQPGLPRALTPVHGKIKRWVVPTISFPNQRETRNLARGNLYTFISEPWSIERTLAVKINLRHFRYGRVHAFYPFSIYTVVILKHGFYFLLIKISVSAQGLVVPKHANPPFKWIVTGIFRVAKRRSKYCALDMRWLRAKDWKRRVAPSLL